MDRYFPSYIGSYSDGASDGSCAQESYSSAGSSPSREFPLNYMPFPPSPNPSGEKSADEPVDVFCDCPFPSVCRCVNYNRNGYKSNNRMRWDEPIMRNLSISSPSPQQVSMMVQPFLHLSPWQPQQWVRADDFEDLGNDHNYQKISPGHFIFREPEVSQNFDQGTPFESHSSFPPWSQFGARRSRLPTYDDPKSDLLKNGRDVMMDDTDIQLIRLREERQKRIPNAEKMERCRGIEEPPLKYRLAEARAMIRRELEERALLNEARGYWGPRKKDRHAKKCKFCLKKNEHEDIVTHHNVKDAQGKVTCPILLQYRCDICHDKGHTIKYCDYNNPDTPHDVILQARFQVYLRNRNGE